MSRDARRRAALRRAADALIPAADGLPSAAEVDVEALLAADARIVADVARALDALAARAADLLAPADVRGVDAREPCAPGDARGTETDRLLPALDALAAADPAAHAALALVVATAYYADPRVRAAIGYEGPRAIPLPAPDADDDLQPLLDRVVARGPRYREIPPS